MRTTLFSSRRLRYGRDNVFRNGHLDCRNEIRVWKCHNSLLGTLPADTADSYSDTMLSFSIMSKSPMSSRILQADILTSTAHIRHHARSQARDQLCVDNEKCHIQDTVRNHPICLSHVLRCRHATAIPNRRPSAPLYHPSLYFITDLYSVVSSQHQVWIVLVTEMLIRVDATISPTCMFR